MPPSFWKWGVDSGCQSCVATTVAPAAVALEISLLICGISAAPPETDRLQFGSAKWFCGSMTRRAVLSSYRWIGGASPGAAAEDRVTPSPRGEGSDRGAFDAWRLAWLPGVPGAETAIR